ncbi:MAG: endo-1,4-beta-xylanase [Saprospiraceae bacterium]|nr:endo-1,4-beta-xylanase [Saprospiraceae bacterium]
MKKIFILALVSLSGCSKREISNCDDNTSLYEQADFLIGVAINLNEYQNNPTYSFISDKQFNSFTAENIFKAEYLHPLENVYDWEDADTFVEASLNQNKNIHGHTIIWHQQLPDWINEFNGTSHEWEGLFKNHIQTIVSHFKGKVAAWDVVNEAFNEDGTLRNSIWLEKLVLIILKSFYSCPSS